LILARQITHKNVIRIFDLGEADGIKFITMEYIEARICRAFFAARKSSSRPRQPTSLLRSAGHWKLPMPKA